MIRIFLILFLLVRPFAVPEYASSVQTGQLATSLEIQQSDVAEINNPVPEKTKDCTPDEEKWWNDLRDKSAQILRLVREKDVLNNELYNNLRWAPSIKPTARQKEVQLQIESVEQQIATTNTEFSALIKKGHDDNYTVPVDDSRMRIIYTPRPNYSEEARKRKVTGSAVVQAEFQADGKIADCRIIRGLGFGLDENAIIAVNTVIFMPAIADGHFVNKVQKMAVNFTLL